jgi:L-fuculose-phosphate aldolase
MTSRWQAERTAVADAARKIRSLGLVTERSGNVSVRVPAGDGRRLLAITPSGRAYSRLSADEVPVVDFDVEPVGDGLPPSSESLLHVELYRARPDVGAVVHTHSVYASVAAVAGLAIPPIIDEMVVYVGGAVRVSEYAFPGTQQLADNVRGALGDRNAALICNHGAVAVGRDLTEALDVCELVERVAQIFVFASLLGGAQTLTDDIVQAEQSIFRMRRDS